MICPHCGKDTNENAVKHWRENLVILPDGKTQVESIGNLPAAARNKAGKIYYSGRGSVKSPVFIVVTEVKE